jgi:beta-galactosidase
MKTSSPLLGLAVVLITGLASGYGPSAQPAVIPDWEDVRLLGVGKEAPHASMVVCPNAAIAKSVRYVANDERVKSPWYISLNGTWKFHYGQTRGDRVPGFFRADFDDRAWSVIRVPGAMEMQGYGVPIYVNIPYPWMAPNPPLIPEDNPNNTIGSYRRRFTVPKSWTDRPVFITFDGVYSFFYLWVNGEKVGLSKESRSPAEFDITKYLHTGENVLAVEVHRWTDASYLEDQDTWRLSGI